MSKVHTVFQRSNFRYDRDKSSYHPRLYFIYVRKSSELKELIKCLLQVSVISIRVISPLGCVAVMSSNNIKVVIKMRPLLERERKEGKEIVWRIKDNMITTFDEVFKKPFGEFILKSLKT